MGKAYQFIAATLFTFGAAAACANADPTFSITDLIQISLAPSAWPSNQFSNGGWTQGFSDGSEIIFNTDSAYNQNASFPGDTVTIGTVGFAPGSAPSVGTQFFIYFNYRITLKDIASNTSGTFDFTGELVGMDSSSPTSITSSYQNLALPANSLNLGGNTYVISIGNTAVPSANTFGSLQLLVVPEPATLSIAMLASCSVLRRRRFVARR